MNIDNKNKKKFEKKFFSLVEKNNVNKLEEFLLNSGFVSFSKEYQQSAMDYIVYHSYKLPTSDLSLWSLTNKTIGINGNIHENADRPLRLASQLNVEYAKFLLTSPHIKDYPDINATNDGSSPILCAIKEKNLEFVKYLLESSDLRVHAKLDIAEKAFNDPLCKACEVDNDDIILYLLSEDAYLNQNGFNPKN